MELITSAAWKYDTAAIDQNRDGTTDMALPPGLLLACDKDNLVTLMDNNTGTIDEGLTKCDPGDPQTTPITWEFKNNETVINIPDTLFGSISGDAQIKELTTTKLRLVKEVTVGPPAVPISITVDVHVTLKH